MKFSQEDPGDDYRIHSYDEQKVVIQQGSPAELTTIDQLFVLTSSRLEPEPTIQSLSALSESDLSYLKTLEIEVLITGQNVITLLSPQLQALFSAQAMGVEQMHIGAACRTYNLLVSEGRKVALVVEFN